MKGIKNVVGILCFVFTLLILSPLVVKADTSTYEEINILEPINDTISVNTSKEDKYFSFKLNEATVLNITFTAEHSSDYEILHLVNGINEKVKGYCYYKGGGLTRTYYNLSADVEYTLHIIGSYSEDKYAFSAVKVKDLPSHIKSAKNIKLDKLVAGQIYTSDDVDYFKFNTGDKNIVYISAISGNWSSPVYSLYKDTSESEAALVGSWNYNSLGSKDLVSDYYKLDKNTTYYLKVALWNGNPNEYSFTLNSSVDVADKAKDAKVIKLNKKIKGNIEVAKDVDYYKFKAKKDGTLKVSWASTKKGYNPIYMTISQKGSSQTLVNDKATTSGETKEITVKKGKWYTIKISGDISDYTFDIRN